MPHPAAPPAAAAAARPLLLLLLRRLLFHAQCPKQSRVLEALPPRAQARALHNPTRSMQH